MSRNDLLIIFVRNPVPGNVKTRLAAAIGDSKAAAVYRATLQATRDAVHSLEVGVRVWADRPLEGDRVWNDPRYEKRLQPAGDLGERLLAAFQDGFNSGFDRIVAIGSDCPDLTSNHLGTAFEMLEKFDIVIGPAQDGGYYLIGMSRPALWLFNRMPWSKHDLLQQTLRLIRRKKWSFGLLPELNDIDTLEDLEKSTLSKQFGGPEAQ